VPVAAVVQVLFEKALKVTVLVAPETTASASFRICTAVDAEKLTPELTLLGGWMEKASFVAPGVISKLELVAAVKPVEVALMV
jgi:hypothetical protein